MDIALRLRTFTIYMLPSPGLALLQVFAVLPAVGSPVLQLLHLLLCLDLCLHLGIWIFGWFSFFALAFAFALALMLLGRLLALQQWGCTCSMYMQSTALMLLQYPASAGASSALTDVSLKSCPANRAAEPSRSSSAQLDNIAEDASSSVSSKTSGTVALISCGTKTGLSAHNTIV